MSEPPYIYNRPLIEEYGITVVRPRREDDKSERCRKPARGVSKLRNLQWWCFDSQPPEDTDELVDFNARLHEDSAAGVAVRNLMSGKHPTTHAGDFTVVEDINARKIVSSMCLISQTWSYGGIPFRTCLKSPKPS